MKKVALTLSVILIVLGTVVAQDNSEARHNVSINIPTVAILDVEDANGEATSISLSPDISELEAGDAINFDDATDNSLWLNYTSVVSENQTRTVSAKMTGDALPSGIKVVLNVSGVTTGNGELGQAVSGDIELTSGNKPVVNSIGSCYTNSGEEEGHQLTYSLSMDDTKYTDLVAKTYTVEVMYTITDN